MMRSTKLGLMAALLSGVNPQLIDALISPTYPSDKKEFTETDSETLSKAQQKRQRKLDKHKR